MKQSVEQPRQPRPVSAHANWGNYAFAQEPLWRLSEDALPMLEAYFEEAGQFQEAVPLDPDWDSLFAYENAGQLKAFSMRDEGGELLGFAVFILTPTLHARGTLHAISDVVYLRPEYRQGLAGVKFLRFCEAQVKAAGARVAHFILKATAAAQVVERALGARIYEVTYMKVL